jgi:hypothetical protein
MTDQHPLTPPPELVASLRNSAPHGIRDAGVTRELWLINSAYAAGSDQELEACCIELTEKIITNSFYEGDKTHSSWRELASIVVRKLRAARRPKPPSLKKQALEALETLNQPWIMPKELEAVIAIRRTLEALDD